MPKIGPFIAGGIVGAVAALLYAPRTGAQTRALVSEKVNAVWGEAADFAESAGVSPASVTERGASVFQGVAETAQGIAQNVQSKVSVSVVKEPVAEEPIEADNDDLREKIEAARERIAAQVVKNAEESQAAAAATVEAPVAEAPAAEAPAAEAADPE